MLSAPPSIERSHLSPLALPPHRFSRAHRSRLGAERSQRFFSAHRNRCGARPDLNRNHLLRQERAHSAVAKRSLRRGFPDHPLLSSNSQIPRMRSNGEVEGPPGRLAGASVGLCSSPASSARLLRPHGPLERLLEVTQPGKTVRVRRLPCKSHHRRPLLSARQQQPPAKTLRDWRAAHRRGSPLRTKSPARAPALNEATAAARAHPQRQRQTKTSAGATGRAGVKQSGASIEGTPGDSSRRLILPK